MLALELRIDCFIIGKPGKEDCKCELALFQIAFLWYCFFFSRGLFLLPLIIFIFLFLFFLEICGSSLVTVGFRVILAMYLQSECVHWHFVGMDMASRQDSNTRSSTICWVICFSFFLLFSILACITFIVSLIYGLT